MRTGNLHSVYAISLIFMLFRLLIAMNCSGQADRH